MEEIKEGRRLLEVKGLTKSFGGLAALQNVDLQIAEMEGRLRAHKISIQVSDEAKKLLAKNGFDPQYGARPLKRYIQQTIENPLAMKIVSGKVKEGAKVKVAEKGGEIVIQ